MNVSIGTSVNVYSIEQVVIHDYSENLIQILLNHRMNDDGLKIKM